MLGLMWYWGLNPRHCKARTLPNELPPQCLSWAFLVACLKTDASEQMYFLKKISKANT